MRPTPKQKLLDYSNGIMRILAEETQTFFLFFEHAPHPDNSKHKLHRISICLNEKELFWNMIEPISLFCKNNDLNWSLAVETNAANVYHGKLKILIYHKDKEKKK